MPKKKISKVLLPELTCYVPDDLHLVSSTRQAINDEGWLGKTFLLEHNGMSGFYILCNRLYAIGPLARKIMREHGYASLSVGVYYHITQEEFNVYETARALSDDTAMLSTMQTLYRTIMKRYADEPSAMHYYGFSLYDAANRMLAFVTMRWPKDNYADLVAMRKSLYEHTSTKAISRVLKQIWNKDFKAKMQ